MGILLIIIGLLLLLFGGGCTLILLFCGISARRRGDTRETLGWDHRWLAPCARLTLRWAGLPLLALLVWAAWPPWPSPERLLYGAKGAPASLHSWPWPVVLALGLLRYPLWALAQEYALLSFCGNRWRALAAGRSMSVVASTPPQTRSSQVTSDSRTSPVAASMR